MQARAEAKVERILDATALLLERDGLSAISTNGIAAEAGVNISVLYRYFADKFEILEALADRTYDRVRVAIEEAVEAAAPRSLEEGLSLYLESLLKQPGLAAISSALFQPRLLKARRRGKERQIATVAEFVPRFLLVPVSKREAEEISRAVVHAASGVIVECLAEGPRRRRALVRELAKMLGAYFESRALEAGYGRSDTNRT
jgi:AcrR family transcriptional regulator